MVDSISNEDTAGATSSSGTDEPGKPNHKTIGFHELLHTHNPFYLISCFLIIYGLQGWATGAEASGGLLPQTLSMAGGIAGYSLLMSLTCIAVVRLGKVWEDARSIFLVVLISLVALSTSFDQLCIEQFDPSVGLAVAGFLFSLATCEALIQFCGLRLTRWYRAAMYSMFGVFFGSPPLLGYFVAERYDTLAGAGSALFSIAFAAAMLLLIPAVALGRRSARRNGTPWRWPWYPLAAFAVITVLACIRTHAIWMSFGFLGKGVTFEPMLLLPILAALLILFCEAGIGLRRPGICRGTLLATPLLLLCGLSGSGMTHLPIQSFIADWLGSGWTVAILTVSAVFLYMTMREIPGAVFGVPATILLAGFTAPLPDVAESVGLQPWMVILFGAAILYWTVFRLLPPDWLWASLAGIVAAAIAIAGRNYGLGREGYIAAAFFAWVSMMVLGAVFRTELAEFLRVMAAALIVIGCGIAIYQFVFQDQRWPVITAMMSGAIVALGYMWLVRRSGWIYVAALQAIVMAGLIGYSGVRAGALRQFNWPISSGVACFFAGIAITASKTSFYARARERRAVQAKDKPRLLEPGL